MAVRTFVFGVSRPAVKHVFSWTPNLVVFPVKHGQTRTQ